MPAATLNFRSTNDNATVEEVIQRLRKLDGVVNIGKEDTAEGVSGFVVFDNAELAAAARNRADNDIFTLIDPALDKPPKGAERKAAAKKAEKSRKGTTAIPVGELFTGAAAAAPPAAAQDGQQPQRRPRTAGGEGRRGGRGAGPRGPKDTAAQPQGDDQQRNTNRRRGQQNRQQRPRTITAYVACVHNVPYSATNDMVFHAFKHTGHILEIARAERLALLYMREPEMVIEAIVQMNGKPFMNSTLAVCSGGEIKLPVPQQPQPPQEGAPHPHHHHHHHAPHPEAPPVQA